MLRKTIKKVISVNHVGQAHIAGSFLPQRTISKNLGQILIGNVASNFAGVLRKDQNGRCNNMTGQNFGACGPGPITPGNFVTLECYGHDYCVCAYGHLACLNAVPAECGIAQSVECFTLWQAAASWFIGIWDMMGEWWTDFWAWVDSWFEQPPPCPPNLICQT